MTNPNTTTSGVDAARVHETLARHMLADGFPLVFDFEKSRGAWLHDAVTGKRYLDLFSFFASQPVGFNHPRIVDDGFQRHLARMASCKPTNSDVYSTAMADFVHTFAETCVPASHRDHLFFIEGGGLAVENALKAAFDWKYRKNQAAGRPLTEDLEVIHFNNAFHGRTGYTLPLTNTHDPRKYEYFPKFKWPRVTTPACSFPLEGAALDAVIELENSSLAEIRQFVAERGDRIAALIIETIQGEGGDNHFRPEFLRALRGICDEGEILLVFDEIQTGMGLTGTWWAFEQLGVAPDIFCFGKKSQVCGIAATHRLDEVDSVFQVASRINSTWGGNLIDMVRCQRFIEIIRDENLLDNARQVGAYALEGLSRLAADCGEVSNVRGRGLMLAFDLPTTEARDGAVKGVFDRNVIMLPSGDRSIRFRPVLDIDRESVDRGIEAIGEVVRS